MANSIDSNLIVDAVANTAIMTLQNKLSPLRDLVTFSTSDAAAYGTVQVPVVDASGFSVQTFNGTFTMQDVSANAKSFTLNPLFVSFAVTDYENNRSMALANTEALVAGKVTSLCNQIERNLWASLSASSALSPASYAVSAFDSGDVNDIRTQCMTLGYNDPALVATNAFYGAALGSMTSTENYSFVDAARNGQLGRVKGVRMYETANLPSGVGGYALDKTGASIAFRYWQPQDNAYDVAKPIVDPKTGIPLGLRIWADPNTGGLRVVITALVGYGPLDSGAIRKFSVA